MIKRVVGLDVSKDNVAVCLLTEQPDDPRSFYLEGDFKRLYANTKGIQMLLEYKPDIAILEPTGVNYSKIWVTKLLEAGVSVALVGHNELKIYRKSLDLPDKDDFSDCLALACYWFQYHRVPTRFALMRDELVAKMRDRVLRLHHLNRLQNPLMNRVKQDLAWAFPERCKTGSNATLFWRWLAGEAKSVRYDSELADTCGLGLSDDIRFAAQQIVSIHRRELDIETELEVYASDPRFKPYRDVFKTFGFGNRTSALLISQIFPLENYLENGKPKVILSRSKQNPNNKTQKNISERKFKKALGVAPEREWSGDGKATHKAGSQLCRTALWQWIFTRVEVKRNRLKNPDFIEIAEYYDVRKEQGIPVKLVRARTSAFAARRLFYKLVNELNLNSAEN